MVYLDNAATSGRKPEPVIRAVDNALKFHSANPGRGGYKAAMEAAELIYDCRKKTAGFFGVDRPDKVCFTAGCTESLNFALKGALSPGDHVIASSLEHNAAARPLYALSRRGVSVDFAEVIFGDDDATVRSFERLIRRNTKVIICMHASNVTGHILPIGRLGRLCRDRGIIFIVDAAQTAGVIPVDMTENCIDILCTAPHKGLLAPMGVGVMVCMKDLPNTVIEGGTGSMSVSRAQPAELPDRYESGTVNLPGIAGLSAGIDFVRSRPAGRIYKHELSLITEAYDLLASTRGIRLYTERPEPGRFMPVLSFNTENLSSTEAAAELDGYGIAVRGGLHCAPNAHRRIGTLESGTVRISTGYFNTRADIAVFADAVRKIIKKTLAKPIAL